MAQLSPAQRAWRRRIEVALHVAAPALDFLLTAGDRLSRAVEREDLDWVPPRRSLPAHPASLDEDETRRS